MSRVRAIAMILALVAVSCHASYPTAPNFSNVTVQVLYDHAMSAAYVGSWYTFHAYAVRSDGAWQDVTGSATWGSSNSAVMTPQSTPGSYGALAPGQADVTATYQSLTATLSIPVIRSDTQAYPQLYIVGGDPRTVGNRAQVDLLRKQTSSSYEYLGNAATWASANPLVVTVGGGYVTAIAPGTTVLRATYGGRTVECGVSVVPRGW